LYINLNTDLEEVVALHQKGEKENLFVNRSTLSFLYLYKNYMSFLNGNGKGLLYLNGGDIV
jgi:hypothetical protein